MEWIGFIVMVFLGGFATLGGGVMAWFARRYSSFFSASDRFAGHIIFAVGVGILWFACEHAPFTVVLK